MLLGFALLQVTSSTVEIWISGYLWGKNHPKLTLKKKKRLIVLAVK